MVSKAVSIGFIMMLTGFGITYLIITKQFQFEDYRIILFFLVVGVLGLLILHYRWKRR